MSEGWRDGILRHFAEDLAEVFPLTVVWDPRGLLADPIIHGTVERRGFLMWVYEDPLQFRFAYETKLRKTEDRGGAPASLVLTYQGTSLNDVPFDVLARARAAQREFQFSVPELFPSLAPASLDDLDPAWFDRLYQAVRRRPPESSRGLNASRDFLLRELFELDTEKIDRAAEVLTGLCRLHLYRQELPDSLAEHLVRRMEGLEPARHWPVEEMVRDRKAFFAFLQEQWPAFVERLASGQVSEGAGMYGTPTELPELIPFEDATLRTWVGALFLEGALEPVPWKGRQGLRPDTYWWGITKSLESDSEERARALGEELSTSLPSQDATYEDWLGFAPRWAEFTALTLRCSDGSGALRNKLDQLWEQVDEAFHQWMVERFGALELVPKPIMLHKVLPHLRAQHDTGTKVALLVMDGMAWSQWTVLRDGMAIAGDYTIAECSVFAWVPTITPVSRQALFAAAPPRDFAESITSTRKDESHWSRFWMEHGLDPASVQFLPPRHREGSASALQRLREAAEHPHCKVLAMTAGTIDEMSHGAVGGASALLAQLDDWSRNGWVGEGVSLLLEEGFDVWITADHGNLECVGTGRPKEGALADERGARARTFSDGAVRRMIAEQFPNSLSWSSAGLPESYLPLLSTGRSAFESDGQSIISHGSIALEEVIVPLIRITS